ncbi:MAG: hypothetical protein C4320_06360 [Armatimonadota bacterium]
MARKIAQRKRGAVKRNVAKGKGKSPARTPPELTHRHYDSAGIVLLALAAVAVLAVAGNNAGALGEGMKAVFTTLFGRGAVLVPIVLGGIGIGLLRGRREAAPLFSTGIGLIFIAILGGLASSLRGDWLDPIALAKGGGYLGGVLAWGADSLLGGARAVLFVVIGLIGAVITLDRPLRDYLALLRHREPADSSKALSKPETSSRPVKVTEEDEPARERLKPTTIIRDHLDERPLPKPKVEKPEAPALKEGYILPSVELLTEPPERPKRSPEEVQRHIGTIEGTLSQFGIEADVVEVATGPTVTRYEIQLAPGIRVAKIVSLADNIAMDMAATGIRVEAPIPGKSAIGLEMPNATPTTVVIRELADDPEFLDALPRLTISLGKDVAGVNRYADLTKMPHLLIAGATNSGKSIGLAALIMSLLMRNTPRQVRLVMVDPKRVELTLFDRVPHLMCPVIKDVKDAPGVFRAVIREMERRYDLLSELGVRNIEGWNEKASFNEKLPYIVVVVDELADLMVQAKAEVETSIVRIAQLARAVGIHLVIATQRPSVDVITGTIKANIPSRIAFSVASQIDSRTILDMKGAESLIGKGDMLYAPIDANKPLRVQGCFVSEKEIERVCRHWREQEGPNYTIDPAEFRAEGDGDGRLAPEDDGDLDPLWQDAVTWVVERGQASTSDIQRKFKIGFQRASRLLDQMEGRAIVGPRDGPRPREVLISPGELDTIFGPVPKYDMGTSIEDL